MAQFTISCASLSLGSATGRFIVVPSGQTSTLDFTVVMDGQTYTATTASSVKVESGKVYKYALTMHSTGLSVSTVTVTTWVDGESLGSADAQLYVDLWATAKESDGVYAIKSDGTPVAYASIGENSFTGVGFVLNGKAYQLAKTVATSEENVGSESFVHLQKNNHANIAGLTDYSTVDGTNTYGFLPLSDGVYAFEDVPELSDNWASVRS